MGERRSLEHEHRDFRAIEGVENLAKRQKAHAIGYTMRDDEPKELLPGFERQRDARLREVEVDERGQPVRFRGEGQFPPCGEPGRGIHERLIARFVAIESGAEPQYVQKSGVIHADAGLGREEACSPGA